MKNKTALIVGGVIVFIILLAIIGGSGSNNNPAQTTLNNNQPSVVQEKQTIPAAESQPKTNKASAKTETAPTPQSQTPSVPQFKDGNYIVGADIQPGTYRTRKGSSDCYYSRLSGFGGSLSEIISNENTDAPAVITIAAADKGFKSSRCGTWNKIAGTTQVPTPTTYANWHQAYSVTNNYDINAVVSLGPFALRGTQFRVSYACTPLPPPATSGALGVSLLVLNDSPSPPYRVIWGPTAVHCPIENKTTIDILSPGQYYLSVVPVLSATYTVTVEDYY